MAPGGGRVQVALHQKFSPGPEASFLPGHALADCDAIAADGVSVPVTWRGNGDLAPLAGTPLPLLVELGAGSRLFGFAFA